MPTDAEIEAFLKGTNPVNTVATDLLPVTNAAIAPNPDIAAMQRKTTSLAEKQRQVTERNRLNNVPLDVQTGLSGWERMMYELRGNREAEIEALQNKYGEENVRLHESGTPIIRAVDAKTGKLKDILVDPDKMDAWDLISVAGLAPELIGGILALRGGRAAPWLKNLTGIKGAARDVLIGSTGAEAAGTAKDIGLDALDPNIDIEGQRILTDRFKNLGVDVGLGAAGYPVGKFFRWIRDPLTGSRGQVQFDALAAREYFKRKYGVDIPLSVGEQSGSPLFSRTETFIEKLPGGSGPVKQLRQKAEQELIKLQGIITGAAPESETVGRQAIGELQSQVAPSKQAAEEAAGKLGAAAKTGVMTDIAAATQPGEELQQHLVGKGIRERVTALRNEAKTEADRLYAEVNRLPGGTGRVFSADTLAQSAEGLLKKLPSKGDIPISEFAPDEVINRLKALANLKGEKLSLSDLQQMRRDTYEAIPRSEGVPGRGAHYLGEIGDMLTQAIEKGAGQMPTPELKNALTAANKFYREKVVPFNRQGITQLFRTAEEGGFVGDFGVFQSFANDPDKWRILKETLGPASPEFTRVRRAIADDLIQSNLNIDGQIDAKKLINSIQAFRADKREIFQDVLGPKANDILSKLTNLRVAEGDALPTTAIKGLLTGNNPLKSDLQALITSQQVLAGKYKNSILKAVASGELDASTIKPSEFVTKFVNTAEPSELREVVGMLSSRPALLDDIRAKAVENLFSKGASVSPEAVGKIMAGELPQSATGTTIASQLRDKGTQQKLKTLLGTDMYRDVEEYAKLTAAREFKEQSFSSAGGISAGGQIATLVQKGPLKYLVGAVKDWVASKLITSNGARALLENNARDAIERYGTASLSGNIGAGAKIAVNVGADLISALVASPWFLRQVAEEMPGSKGESAVRSIKESIDRYVLEQNKAANRPAQLDRSEQIKKFLESK